MGKLISKDYLGLYIVYTIVTLYLFLTGSILIYRINDLISIEYFYYSYEALIDIHQRFEIKYSYFLVTIVTFVALFFKNRISWILIQSFIYFLFFNVLFEIFKDEINPIWFFSIASIFILFIILLFINSKKNSLIYKVNKDRVILYNVISTIIGFCYVFYLKFI